MDGSGAPPAGGWKRAFAAILVCYLVAFSAFQLVFPYLPLYLRSLGESETSAIAWAGAINASLPLVMIFASAFWGNLGDRVGLKPMMVRACVVATLVLGSASLVTHAWQALVVFIVHGLAGSAPPTLLTLAAATLPRARLNMGMGAMQTVQFLGFSVGPLLGGAAIATLGFRPSFQVAAALTALTLLLGLLLIPEPPKRAAGGSRPPSLRQALGMVRRAPHLRAPLLGILAYQGSYATGFVLLPLHVQALGGDDSAASTAVGVVLACSGLGTAIGSTALAWVGGRLGAGRVALVCLLLAGICTLPCFWITDVTTFAALRFVVGFFSGGVVPAMLSVLGEAAGRGGAGGSATGTVYGFSQSANSGGFAWGSAAAALVAAWWALPAMHLVRGTILLATGLWWARERRR